MKKENILGSIKLVLIWIVIFFPVLVIAIIPEILVWSGVGIALVFLAWRGYKNPKLAKNTLEYAGIDLKWNFKKESYLNEVVEEPKEA